MITQNTGRLFKADERPLSENETHRLHATFNPNGARNPKENTFGALTSLNDETLASNQSVTKTLLSGTVVMIIPLTGAAECHFSGDNSQIVVPGEAFTYYSHKGNNLKIKNPYEESLINFLYITFSATIPTEILLPKDFLIAQANFTDRNKFHKLFESFQNGLSSHIGIFNSRSESVYSPNNRNNGIFAFVISGIFEVQNNLVQERDGIAFKEENDITIRALSENSILLLIEIPLNGYTAL
jgi:hypothetical protein